MNKNILNYFCVSLLLFITSFFILGLPIVEDYKFYFFLFFIILFFFFKLKQISYKKYITLFIIIFISLIFNNISKIKVGHNIVIFNEISKNYYEENLPKKVFNFFENNYIFRLENSLCSRNDDTCWVNYDPEIIFKSGISKKNLFYKSSNTFLNKTQFSYLTNYINFKNLKNLKINAINNLDFNFYNQDNTSKINNREYLPFFIYFELPQEYIKQPLCWKGNIFLEYDVKKFKQIYHSEFKCKKFNKGKSSINLYAVSDGNENNLIIKFITYDFLLDISIFLLFLALCLLWYFKFNILNLIKSIIFFIFAILVLFYINQNFNFGFSIFSGGNDGIQYMSYSNRLYQYLSTANFYEFFKGMESVFYFPSSLRYFWVINKLFFGDTIYGYILVILLMPFIIFNILKNYISSNRFILLFLILFFLTRFFEGYAFSNITMLQHVYAGDAEPLAIFFFLISLMIFLKFEKNNYNLNWLYFFLIGFTLFLSLSLRPNYFPTCFLLFFIAFIRTFQINNLNFNGFLLIFGFSFLFLIPIHNLYYGNDFYLFSSGSHHNTHAPVMIWIEVFNNFLSLNFHSNEANSSVYKQFVRWIKPSDLHYVLSFVISFILLIITKNFMIITLCLLSFSQHFVCLIYEPEGRYSYLAWFLTFLLVIYVIDIFQDYLKKKLKLFFNNQKSNYH